MPDGPSSRKRSVSTVRDVRLEDHAAGELSLLVVGEEHFAVHALPGAGAVTIGRAADADIRLDDPSVSRDHAVLHMESPILIEDLGSANGTRVRDRLLAAGERAELSPEEVVAVGSLTVILQRRQPSTRPRRIWSYGYFEGRLEDECARAERFGAGFSLLHVLLERELPAAAAQQCFGEVMRSVDVLGAYGPGEYELLLIDVTPAEAGEVADRVRRALTVRGASARTGVAHYPQDGRDPDLLAARAREQVRGRAEAGASEAGIIVCDSRMRELHVLVERIAGGDISVLLLGETGVGKEVFAETIHRLSARQAKPFLRLNCAALSETLLESELFGHEKGAFTGAAQAKPGLLETASGGTVFLDEIGDLPMAVQVKLLRVLEERKVLRVGGLKQHSIDVRFVSATNRDLEREVRNGNFREDLYYRLNGMSLLIPPLRDRTAEIGPLVQKFIGMFCRRASRYPEPRLSPEALALMESYSWPGNIRELRNVIERAVLLCTGEEITTEHIPVDKMCSAPTLRSVVSSPPADEFPEQDTLNTLRIPALRPDSGAGGPDGSERDRIIDALNRCAGNQTSAAKMLGISRRTLINRLDAYGIPRPRKGRKRS